MKLVRVVALLLAGLMASNLAFANPSFIQSAEDKAAIVAVIEDQLSAFQSDDGPRAFSHASPMIQSMFGTVDNFMNMVRQGYQQVYRPKTVEFRDLVMTDGLLEQRVFFIGPSGKASIGRYFMQQQPDGSWKINGVVIEKAEDLSV